MPALLVSHGVKEYLAKDLKLKLEEVKVQKRDAVAAKKLPDVVADIKLYTNFFISFNTKNAYICSSTHSPKCKVLCLCFIDALTKF